MNKPTRGLIIDYNSVAAYLAHEDADAQSAFLNTFIKELHAACATAHHVEMQMCYVMEKLTPEAKKAAGMLAYEEKP